MERQIAKDRLEVFEKIKQYEQEGGESLFKDVENDPPPKMLMPEDVDYLKKKLSSKIKYHTTKKIIRKMFKNFAQEHQVTVVGLENLQNVNGGAIITTNHFHYFDTAPIIHALRLTKTKKQHYVVIREGNYQIPGVFGFILRNYTTFPLSSNMKTTINMNKAIDEVLNKGHYVIVYPEQAMWWNYRKPRNYRIGAYRWASRNNVPVIPCFVTMEDMEELEDNGLPKQKLTLHIMKPIYPNNELSDKENAQNMLEQNHKMCVEVYENFYKTKYEMKL